jgi:hypothetical protein
MMVGGGCQGWSVHAADVGASGADEGDVGDFGGAVEAKWEADCTDAAVDVELHAAEVEGSLDVLLAHGGKDERADEGEADLAAVGVAGEHEVDEREAGVLDDLVGEVGLVAHEQDGGVGVGGDGHVEVGGAGTGVVGAGEPEDVAAAFEGVVAVDEDGGAVGFEGRDDVAGADDDVVVAEDAEALGLDGGEDFGADAGGFIGDGHLSGAAADVVAGDEDEVGVEGVDLGDDALEEEGFGELFEVDVGDLDDFEVEETVGEIADGDGEVVDFELVAGVGAGVGGETDAGSGGSRHERPACDGGLWRTEAAVDAGHSPF